MAERLRCESGEFKTRNQFSKRQLDKYDQNRRKGIATASKTGIRCLEHSNTQNNELKCLGPCRRYRELRFFSRNTRRNGKNWCVDCTDWQLKMECGETLPPPGAQLSVEELESIRRSGQPRDDMVLEANVENFDDAESYFVGNGGVSGSVSELSFSAQQSWTDGVIDEDADDQASVTAFSAQPSWVPNDLIDEDADNQASAPPSHFCSTDRAPHWLMPNFGGPPTGLSMATSTTSTDGASVASSGMTMSARDRHDQSASFNGWGSSAASVASSGMTASTRGPAWEDGTSVASSGLTASARGPQIRPQRQPVSFNAWGPSGEYARMVKNPTVVSGSTRTQPAFRPQPNLGRKGWARGSSRKQQPQLPDYLKYDYDISAADDDDELDLGSDDDIIIPGLSAANS